MQYTKSMIALALTSALALNGCFHEEDDEHAHCADGSEAIADSSARQLCFDIDYAGNFPQVDGAYVGKTVHTVTITDIDGNPVDINSDEETVITAVDQYPFMTMLSGHKHSTAVSHMVDSTDSANGKYKMTAYYSMMSSATMGSWEYRIKLTDAGNDHGITKVFVPSVMDTTDDDVIATSMGTNSNDMIDDTSARQYRVWLDNIAVNADDNTTHDLTLYITTKDGGMAMDHSAHMSKVSARHGDTAEYEEDSSSYPAVHTGLMLTEPDATTAALEVTEVTVEVAVADAADADLTSATWIALTEETGMMNHGKFKATAISGLSTDTANFVFVKLTVNSNEMKTSTDSTPMLKFIAPAAE